MCRHVSRASEPADRVPVAHEIMYGEHDANTFSMVYPYTSMRAFTRRPHAVTYVVRPAQRTAVREQELRCTLGQRLQSLKMSHVGPRQARASMLPDDGRSPRHGRRAACTQDALPSRCILHD